MQELRSSALATQAYTPLVRTFKAKPTPQRSFYLVPTSNLPPQREYLRATEINKTDKQDNFPPTHFKVGASGFWKNLQSPRVAPVQVVAFNNGVE
jgi:hypothetical protein